MSKIFAIILSLLYLSFSQVSSAIECPSFLSQTGDLKDAYNPKPDADDLVLPMPCGMKMVFRKVSVPGKGFWGNEQRVVEFGLIDGGLFERSQKIAISGSFSNANDQWHYYIAKYELTIAQYLSIRGLNNIHKVLSASSPLITAKSLRKKKIKKEIEKPVSFFNLAEYQAFVEEYNQWLFQKKQQHLKKMPVYNKMPGFIRFPTEYEWEFAARGGIKTLGSTYHNKNPFDKKDFAKYAWTRENASSRVKRIKWKLPNPLKIYGMFGNVSEYVQGIFRPELWQGKPGGYIVKGGNSGMKKEYISSSTRNERFYVKWEKGKGGGPRVNKIGLTGVRLAIGSLVIHDEFKEQQLTSEYKKYIQTVRDKMPVGKGSKSSITQINNLIANSQGDIDQLIYQLKPSLPEVANILSNIKYKLEKAEGIAYQGTRDITATLYKELILSSKDSCEAHLRIIATSDALNNLKKIIQKNSSIKLRKMEVTLKKKKKKLESKLVEYRSQYLTKFKSLLSYPKPIVAESLNHWYQTFSKKEENSNLILHKITIKKINNYYQTGIFHENWFKAYKPSCAYLNL